MSTNRHYECYSCDAVFKIRHDLDPNYYNIEHCPFCGESLEAEEDSFEQQVDDDE